MPDLINVSVCFGSSAAIYRNSSLAAAFGSIAAAFSAQFHHFRGPLSAYSVEKLRITMIRKFKRIFQSPGAHITDQLCRSELRQAGFSCGFYYPLVHTVRNAAQIANKIAAHFKTEFFNRIDQLPTLEIGNI